VALVGAAAPMKKSDKSLPPTEQKDEAAPLEAKRRVKSFVRITPSRRPKAAANGVKTSSMPTATSAATTSSFAQSSAVSKRIPESKTQPKSSKKEVIVEGEVVGDEDEEGSEDVDGADDDAFARVVEGEVEFDERLPAVTGYRADNDSPFSEVEVEVEVEDENGLPESASDEKGLVVSNALQRYLADLRRYPLMTIEEERETARRAHEQNDVTARNRLVTANLRLVVKIAMEYRRAYSQILDLIQEGNAGLVQAVNRFNPYLNVKLSTYGAWWIRAYILKFLMDNKSLVRMGTTDAQRKLFFRLRGEAEKMYALTQRFDAKLLAENIGVKTSDVVEMQQRLTKNDVSLDAPLRHDGDTRHIDTLESELDEPDAIYERKELLELLRERVGAIEQELGERDAYIFRSRILAEEPVTLQEVGDKFGITRERVRQLEARVMKRIKEALIEAGMGK
jgi:RNA polymerase sigma-32 factor